MCWNKIKTGLCKWLCSEEEPITPVEPKKVALLFAINDYPGDSSDLKGCLNDQADMWDLLKSNGFDTIEKYSEWSVTVNNFVQTVKRRVSELKSGDILFIHYSGHGTQVYDTSGDEDDYYDEALYLYDDVLKDDVIYKLFSAAPEGAKIIAAFDSCFSGTATKSQPKGDVRCKFKPYEIVPPKAKLRGSFKSLDLPWVHISGCSDNEYSWDAMIDGKYNGAFSYYATRLFAPELSYLGWWTAIRSYLPSSNFPQSPMIDGAEELTNKVVFSH